MDLELVIKMVQDQGQKEFLNKPIVLPGEAKFITGKAREDSYLHYLETKCGVEITLDKNNSIVGYNIIDEKKFTWFVLKWS
jgi:hypothetical protein